MKGSDLGQGQEGVAVTIQGKEVVVRIVVRIFLNEDNTVVEEPMEPVNGRTEASVDLNGAIGIRFADLCRLFVEGQEGECPYERLTNLGSRHFHWDCAIDSAAELVKQYPGTAPVLTPLIGTKRGERLVLIPTGEGEGLCRSCDTGDQILPNPDEDIREQFLRTNWAAGGGTVGSS